MFAKENKWRKFRSPLIVVCVFLLAGMFGIIGYKIYAGSEAVVENKVVRIDGLMSNLSDSSMVKLSLSVVIDPSRDSETVEDSIRNVVISHLRTMGKPELNGVAGLDFLRSNLLSGSRNALGAGVVKEVFIREFIVQ